MTYTTTQRPHWDLCDSDQRVETVAFQRRLAQLFASITDLAECFDRLGVFAVAEAIHQPPEFDVARTILTEYNRVRDHHETLDAHLYGLTSVNTADEAAQATYSEFRLATLPLEKLVPRLNAWLSLLQLDATLAADDQLEQHRYLITRARIEAAHQMAPAAEELASDLHLSGGNAWSRLREDLSSQHLTPFELDGVIQNLPITKLLTLQQHHDPVTRQRAYEAEISAWKTLEIAIAAALNSIKGETNTLVHGRGWSDALEFSLHNFAIDRQVLEAMTSASRRQFPLFRRYLKAKARLLGKSQLAWFDLEAPVGSDASRYSFAEAVDFVKMQFNRFHEPMGTMVDQYRQGRWIDAEPRPGKIGGGYCMPYQTGTSRIFLNYDSTYPDLLVLAHELGHAWHDNRLGAMTWLQRLIPSTLAETSSIFCETLVRDGALEGANDQQALVILDGALSTATAVTVDILARQAFEQALFEAREHRELSAKELSALSLTAFREAFGDGVDSTLMHPYLWALKPHYYEVAEPYYNYPYLFGLLFATGLYALYLKGEPDFVTRYNDLLRRSGVATARTLALEFGIELRDEAFWAESLAIISRDVDRFESLVDEQLASHAEE